ncbi:hypothetical protein CIW47_24530 [Mycolicibacterium sp. P1-5]|nr:hypothetical protein CIW47_24530 [Mycolicibacterium sp. P1-5]
MAHRGSDDEKFEAQVDNDEPRRQLAEERQFHLTLVSALAISGVFALAFVAFLVRGLVFYPGRNTADWYSSWGTWAAGIATATAFLITAMGVRVTSAQARADRQTAADLRADDDMAQARLLTIYKIEIPNGLMSLASFRIENRSKDVFFDVTVPFADSPCDVDGTLERRTPDLVAVDNRLHEYLPDGELLVPFRSHTDEEAWFTLVTLHTFNWAGISFAVHYTDAAGRQWKQHFGGKIERVLTTDPVPVRKADRFQPLPQVRRITAEEVRVIDQNGPPYLAQDYDDAADLKASAQDIVSTWEPVCRVGALDIDTELSGLPEGSVWLVVSYAPRPHRLWHNYFGPIIEEMEFHRCWSAGGPSFTVDVHFEVPASDIEGLVGEVDRAIAHANEQFEANELKQALRLVAEMNAEAPTNEESVGGKPIDPEQLEELAARLARPDYDPPSRL